MTKLHGSLLSSVPDVKVMAEQFHIHGLHWDCSCAEAWYGACTEGCGPYQTLTPAAAAAVVFVL